MIAFVKNYGILIIKGSFFLSTFILSTIYEMLP